MHCSGVSIVNFEQVKCQLGLLVEVVYCYSDVLNIECSFGSGLQKSNYMTEFPII